MEMRIHQPLRHKEVNKTQQIYLNINVNIAVFCSRRFV